MHSSGPSVISPTHTNDTTALSSMIDARVLARKIGLDKGRAVAKTLPRIEPGGGRVGIGVRKQQGVRHVVTTAHVHPLLHRNVIPAEQA